MRIAILGTGLMGAGMARRLTDVGAGDVVIWNRTQSRALAVGAGTVVNTPAEAVRQADVVISSLLSAPSLREVYFGPSGAVETACGQIFIETTTAGPEILAELAPALGARGSGIVDAPLLGSTEAVRAGTLTIPVGGADADVERARPVLERLGDVEHVGPLGTAAKLKLLHNSFLAITTAGAAELLSAGSAAGLPREEVFKILARLSPYLLRRERAFLEGVYEPVTFALKTMIKDLELGLDFYHRNGASSEMTALTRELYGEAVADWAELDFTAIVKRYERWRTPRVSQKS